VGISHDTAMRWQENRVLPLGVWLIVLVSLMLDHPVAADSHVRPRHFHSI